MMGEFGAGSDIRYNRHFVDCPFDCTDYKCLSNRIGKSTDCTDCQRKLAAISRYHNSRYFVDCTDCSILLSIVPILLAPSFNQDLINPNLRKVRYNRHRIDFLCRSYRSLQSVQSALVLL